MDENLIAAGLTSGTRSRFKSRIYLKASNTRHMLETAYKDILGGKFTWIPEYDSICEWMSDNNGKGLFLYGSYGRGKTLFMKDIFPVLMEGAGKVCSYYTMTGMTEDILNEVLKKKIVCLDDVGIEGKLMSYGNTRDPFPEIIDRAEQNGNLVIASSNMGARELTERYGQRTVERIISCCKRIPFEGKSFRLC